MKVSVLVKSNSKTESVNLNEDGSLTIKIRTPPVEGKANKKVVELLAEYFDKPKTSVTLVHGIAGKKKIFEIS